MNDLERDLRKLLESKARHATIGPVSPTTLKRARRREARTVLTVLVGMVAVMTASVVGIQALVEQEAPSPRPAVTPMLPEVPDGFHAVVLPFASLAVPDDWSVLAFKGRPELVQVTNFDPEFTTPCFASDAQALPPLGAILLIESGRGSVEPSLPTWPVAPSETGAGGRDCRGAQEEDFGKPEVFEARWRSGSSSFVALVAVGGAAPGDVRRLIFDSFSTLLVVEGGAPQTEELLGEANLILDAAETPVGPVALYAYRDDFEGGTSWLGIAGPRGSGLAGGGSIGDALPRADESVTMNLDVWGGVVWGTVAPNAVRAELRTVEGETFPAKLVPLPSGGRPGEFGPSGLQAVWGVVQGRTADRVTTLLYDPDGNPINDYFPSGPRVSIATGTDPEGGSWELYLDQTNEGVGLGFTFDTGGGGAGCCLQALEGDFRLDGWGSGGDEPGDITALGSERLDRVVFEAASGERIDGAVFDVPVPTLGIPKVALVIVPRGIALEGTLVGLDSEGDVLGSEPVTSSPGEPSGPTPEIDAAWTLLRVARDAILEWSGLHGRTIERLTVLAAREEMGSIPWNGSPTAIEGEVSLRGPTLADGSEAGGWTGWNVAIVTTTQSGLTYCMGVNVDEGGGGNFRYGTSDAGSYAECRGGWPELKG